MAKHANIDTIDEADLDSELVELEFDEESVAYYIVDEDDNEIGVCLIEDGKEVEYLYDDSPYDDEEAAKKEALKAQTEEVKAGIEGMKDELETFKGDAQEVAGELKQTAEELRGMLDDVKDSFRIFPKNKKK